MGRLKNLEERLICEVYRASTIPRISKHVMNGDLIVGVANNALHDIDIYKTSIVPNPAFLEEYSDGYITGNKRFTIINHGSHYAVGTNILTFTYSIPTIEYKDVFDVYSITPHTFLSHYIASLIEYRYNRGHCVDSNKFSKLTIIIKLPKIVDKSVITSIKTYLLDQKMYKLKFITPTEEQTERYLFKYGYKCLDFNNPIWGEKDEI